MSSPTPSTQSATQSTASPLLPVPLGPFLGALDRLPKEWFTPQQLQLCRNLCAHPQLNNLNSSHLPPDQHALLKPLWVQYNAWAEIQAQLRQQPARSSAAPPQPPAGSASGPSSASRASAGPTTTSTSPAAPATSSSPAAADAARAATAQLVAALLSQGDQAIELKRALLQQQSQAQLPPPPQQPQQLQPPPPDLDLISAEDLKLAQTAATIGDKLGKYLGAIQLDNADSFGRVAVLRSSVADKPTIDGLREHQEGTLRLLSKEIGPLRNRLIRGIEQFAELARKLAERNQQEMMMYKLVIASKAVEESKKEKKEADRIKNEKAKKDAADTMAAAQNSVNAMAAQPAVGAKRTATAAGLKDEVAAKRRKPAADFLSFLV